MLRFKNWLNVSIMKSMCNYTNSCVLYFLYVVKRVVEKTIKKTIRPTVVKMGMYKGISYKVMAAVLEIKERSRWKSRSWRKNDLTIAEMCLSIDISDWKTASPRFFAESFGEIKLESILKLQFGLEIEMFWSKRKIRRFIRINR